MAAGAPVPPPLGFVDLCRRTPAECGVRLTGAQAETFSRDAQREYWRIRLDAVRQPGDAAPARARGASEPAITPLRERLSKPEAMPQPLAAPEITSRVLRTSMTFSMREPTDRELALNEGPTSGRPFSRLSRNGSFASSLGVASVIPVVRIAPVVAAALASPTALVTPVPAHTKDRDETRAVAPFAPTPADWAEINRINRAVNTRIRMTADSATFGRQDFWRAASEITTQGDCEDYVIAKRHEMIAAGIPADALSIALVRTSWNVRHAVLLVTTAKGDYVLDNLSPWVLPWDQIDYRWESRQVAGSPMQWVSLTSTTS